MTNQLVDVPLVQSEDEYLQIKKRKPYKFICKCCGKEVTTQRRTETVRSEKQKLFLCQDCLTKQVCQEKYGCDYPGQSAISKQHQKETCLKKYGVENPFQAEVCKEKIKQTSLERYGFEHPIKNKDIQEKRKQTCLNTYGVENVFQSDIVKNKIVETNMSKYGVACFTQTEDYKIKSKQTCLEKYGVKSYLQSEIAIKNHRSIYKYDDIGFDSSWEIMFYIFCKCQNLDIKRCETPFVYIYNDEQHYYYPDFEVNGQLYEIKGDQFWKEDGTMQNPYDHNLDGLFEAKHQCGLKNGVNFISKLEIKEIKKFIDETFGKDYILQFKS